jgi:tetratricopeptide (TPR) repeat protein
MSAQDAAHPDEATRFTAAPADADATRFSDLPPADPDPTRFSTVPTADTDETHYGASPAPGTSPTPTGRAPLTVRDRRLPRRFAGYVLLEEIARGGMGVVYKAHQLGPDGKPMRLVALKMMLGGAEATPEVTQRFWNEARAAAGLNHPGIVPVVEAGDHDGQPFYSMEFVEGCSLAERVQAGGPLLPQEAARLLRQVAEAVQAAHEQGIVHRDIKPANILVAAGREGGTVGRLTDFGLARTREGAGSLTGEKLGTPSYMAPEQAAGKVHAVSAVTDVYGLGAVLYCLLTGRPPFQSSSPLETMRLVLEQEPVPVRQLNPAVPRDLETVCHKCLQKEPARRYAAAGELTAELGRFLGGEAVRARPVGRLERGWRWCRRNPALAGLLALLALVVLGSLVGLTTLYFKGERQRQLAEQREAAARAVTRFYEEHVLTAARPKGWDGGAGKDVTLRQALDQAVPHIEKAFAGQPELEATVRHTLGMTYWYLGQFDAANPLLKKAHAIRLELLGPDHPDTLTSLHDLARQRWCQGKLAEAVSMCRQALDGRRRVLGAEHPDTLWSQLFLGLFLYEQNQYDKAEAVLRPAVECCRRTLGPDHVQTLHGQSDLALVLWWQDKEAESVALDRQTLAGRRRSLGPDHPDTLRSLDNLDRERPG